jgi:hypothetical protein
MTVKNGARGPDRPGRARLAATVVFLVAAAASPALAHPEFSTLGTNRYVTAAVFDGRVDVTDAWLHGALTATELRRQLDLDHDGSIADDERAAAEGRLRAEGAFVTVELDGREATAPLAVTIDLGGDPRVGPGPLVVERRHRFAAAPKQVRLTVTREPPRVLETELSIVLGPGLALAQGPDRVRFDGPRRSSLETRAATFTIAPLSTAHAPRLTIAAALVLVAATVAWLARRKRPPAQRRGIDADM